MDLAFLQPLYERRGPWASVYVDTSHHTQDTPHQRHLMAQAVARELASQGADEATCEAVRAAVDDLQHSSEPHGRAFFAHDGEVVLDPSLARPPQRETTVVWAPLPHVSPLLNLLGEDPTCLVVYVTRGGADLELRSALGSSEAGEVVGRQWPLHRTASSDWSERHFQLAVENTWSQNAEEIARETASCLEETRADLVILVGEERDRRVVRDHLPPRVRECTVEASHGSGSRLLDEEVEDLRATHERQKAEADLGRFLAARGRDRQGGAGAVEGVPALVEAAREHRIDELLINLDGADAHRQVWIGEEPDQVAVRRADLRILGEQHAWAARADDALLRSVVAAGAPALSVQPALGDDSPVVPTGGLGALLRWA
jgi:hypothetical protein